MYKIGQEIEFLAAGKVSRLDGVAGTWVRGIVTSIEGRLVHFKKQYDSLCENGVADIDDTSEL